MLPPACADGSIMTIGPLLHNEAFEPEDVQAMSAAFEDVCKALDLADDANGTRELIAGQIIALAHRGERSRTPRRIGSSTSRAVAHDRPTTTESRTASNGSPLSPVRSGVTTR